MDIKNTKILEALRMQPLSEEEMAARHILGRLYGPIATCTESTRNGRLYNKPLWEKALKDEIFLEKVATKALFLELGHPADREETDMKQACACIPEVPKIVGNDLYAYVDILDTPNGRLLKTLVDYGFVPGISSRGSGDVMDDNQVDPETFFLETWDIVQLPAVRKARLNVCESLDSNSIKLRKALAESYQAAKEDDKDTMKKALENLNINIDEELESESQEEVVEEDYDNIPWDEEDEDLLLEADEEDESEESASDDIELEEPVEETEEASDEETPVEDEEAAVEDEEETEAEDTEDENVDDADISDMNTVGDAVEMLQEYDSDMKIEFEPLEVDGKEFTIDKLSSFIDDENEEDPILVIGVDCEDSEETSDDTEEDIELETEDEETSEEEVEEIDTIEDEDLTDSDDSTEEDESAEDAGEEDEVMESLKSVIRQKEALETEVNELRKAKAVGDAKEQELQERLNRYSKAFKQASAEASKVQDLTATVQELTEKLTQSNAKLKVLTEKVNNAQQLKESFESRSKYHAKRLTESINTLTQANKDLEAKLEGQTKLYSKKLEERTNLAKTYKARFIETLTKYIESKANMLSIQPSEITSRLNENYTLADVDAVCDQILESTVNFSRLPFSGRTKTSARITESVNKKVNTSVEYGYDIDDSLLELAGLKK